MACSRSGNVARAEELLSRIVLAQGIDDSVDDFNVAIHTCTQAGDMARVEEYLAQMEGQGPAPNMRTYNSVLNAYAAQGDASRTESFVERMKLMGVQPNFVTYSTICKVYARLGAVDQIEKVMGVVEEHVGPLNEYFFASLISACGKASPPQPERAESALGELVRRGLKAQSVKRALSRVVGDDRTAQLFKRILGQARSTTPNHASLPLPPGPVRGLPVDAPPGLSVAAAPAAARPADVASTAASRDGSPTFFHIGRSSGSGSSTSASAGFAGTSFASVSPQGSSAASDTSSGKGQRQTTKAARPADGGKAGGKGGAAVSPAKGAAKGSAKGSGGKAKSQGTNKFVLAKLRNLPAGGGATGLESVTAAVPAPSPAPRSGHRASAPPAADDRCYQAQLQKLYWQQQAAAPHQVPQPRRGDCRYVPGSALLQAASLPIGIQITYAQGMLGCSAVQ